MRTLSFVEYTFQSKQRQKWVVQHKAHVHSIDTMINFTMKKENNRYSSENTLIHLQSRVQNVVHTQHGVGCV